MCCVAAGSLGMEGEAGAFAVLGRSVRSELVLDVGWTRAVHSYWWRKGGAPWEPGQNGDLSDTRLKMIQKTFFFFYVYTPLFTLSTNVILAYSIHK